MCKKLFVFLALSHVLFVCADACADTSAEWRTWVNACVKRLDSDDYSIRDGAMAALVKLGPGVVPYLVPHLNSQSPEIVNRIREITYKLGSQARDKFQEILDKKSAPPDTLTAVNNLLENLKQIDKDTVLKFLEPSFDENGNQIYKNPEATARQIIAIGKVAVPVLIEYWKSNGENLSYYADEAVQQALLKLGDAGIAAELEEIVWTNAYAAKPLYKFKGKESVPVFIDIIRDFYTNNEIRGSGYSIYPVIDVIREAKPAEAVPVLSDIITKPECYDKDNIARILADIGDPACVPSIKKALEAEKQQWDESDQQNFFPYEYYSMNDILCDFGDKDGVTNLIGMLESPVLDNSDYDWYLSQVINSLRKLTGKDLTKDLRPYRKNRQAIFDAYTKWWGENKDKAEWDSKKKKFSVKE